MLKDYIFYYVLERVNHSKVIYNPGQVFPELKTTNMDSLITEKIITPVEDYIKAIEQDGEAKVAEIQQAIDATKEQVASVRKKVEATKAEQEAKLREELGEPAPAPVVAPQAPKVPEAPKEPENKPIN